MDYRAGNADGALIEIRKSKIENSLISLAGQELGGGEFHHRGAGLEHAAIDQDGTEREGGALDIDGHAAAEGQEAAGIDDHPRSAPPGARKMGVADDDEPRPGTEDAGEGLGPGRSHGPGMEDLQWPPGGPAFAQNRAEGGEWSPPHPGAVKLNGKGGAFAGLEAFLEIQEGVCFHAGQFARMGLADDFGLVAPGGDVVEQEIAVRDQDGAIHEVDVAQVGEDRVVVAVDENGARARGLASLAHEDGVAHADAAPAQVAEFDRIAIKDDGFRVAEEGERVAWAAR